MSATFTVRDKTISRTIHRLFWRATWTDKWRFILAVLFRFPAFAVYNVCIPVVVAYGLQAIVTKNFTAVDTYVWGILGLGALYCLLWGIGGIFVCKNGELGQIYLQRHVFENYINKDYEFYNNTYIGSLGAQAARLRDAFNEYNQLFMIHIPKQLVIVASSIIIIATQSVLLAAITLIAMTLVLSFTIASSRWRMRYRRALSEASGELAGVVGDALGHGTTVKSFAAEVYEKERLNKALLPWARIQYRSWISSIPADIGRMILATIATAILLVFTSRMYQEGQISIAVVILVQLFVVRLVASTLDIAEIIKSYEATMGGAHQAIKTLLTPTSVNNAAVTKRLSKRFKASIAFKKASYSYPDANHKSAVANFTLIIEPGEKVGLVGYSGSGKTTLTKLLLRFMDTTSGTIAVGDIDIRELAQTDLRSLIAYVPQEALLFHRSIADNIGYGQHGSNIEKVKEAAKAAYVDEFVNDMPQGYDTIVGERGIKLSGGQRQRVAIARALLKNAPILVLDEATSALDSRSEKLIQQALWRLMEDRTALVIAHRLSTIQRMDRIVVMDKGKIVQIGTHDELLKDTKGIYAKLWAHQTGGYMGIDSRQPAT